MEYDIPVSTTPNASKPGSSVDIHMAFGPGDNIDYVFSIFLRRDLPVSKTVMQGEYRVIAKSKDTDKIDKGFIAAIVATLQGL